MTAITVDNVTFGYTSDDPVVRNAQFTVQHGEFIGMIGPNGGGKTTILKLLMGFVQPWYGNITILGNAPTYYPNGISYVPQMLRFDKQFPITLLELVLGGLLKTLPWWGGYSKQDYEKAHAVLKKVKLTDCATKPFGSLSGGQMQRALIARALVSDPRILLLDEPTASVDATAEADIYELLTELNKNLTIIMVTHDIRAIIGQVRRILCVQGNVSSMSPGELCEHFALGLYHFPLMQTETTHFAKTPPSFTS